MIDQTYMYIHRRTFDIYKSVLKISRTNIGIYLIDSDYTWNIKICN